MRKYLLLIGIFNFLLSYSQSTRADIIAKKINAITEIYWENDSTQKIEIKNYYSIKGDDSLEFYCGKISFKYIPELDSKGRVIRLDRYDAQDRLDELHIYKYQNDGSYSIELVAHGAGTISYAKYDSRNRCLEDEIDGTYKIIYTYNKLGKLEKVFYKEKNKKAKLMGVLTYDQYGLAVKGEGFGEEKKLAYFKYNNKGLISEMKTVYKDKMGKEQSHIVFFEYEYYEE